MKKFFLKLSALVLLVLFFQLLILSAKISSFEEMKIMDEAIKKKTDVVYFGDSSASNYGLDDTDKSPLPEMIKKRIGEKTLASIDNPAYAAEVFLAFTEYMVREHYFPEFVVIPVNIRSFSPSWDKNPGYQFEDQKAILESRARFMFLKTIGTFSQNRGLSEISQEEFQDAGVYNGRELVGRVKDFETHEYRHYSEENMKNSILYFYLFSLEETHEKISAFSEIAELLSENGIKPVFYITPVDYQTGEKYFPGIFRDRLKENTDLIKSVLGERGVKVLDLSFSLTSDYFAWERYPNEHLNEKGRGYVARKIAERINNGQEMSLEQCRKYGIDQCPSSCVVCPPCEVCSSLSCSSLDFCQSMGINELWYEGIKSRQQDL